MQRQTSNIYRKASRQTDKQKTGRQTNRERERVRGKERDKKARRGFVLKMVRTGKEEKRQR